MRFRGVGAELATIVGPVVPDPRQAERLRRRALARGRVRRQRLTIALVTMVVLAIALTIVTSGGGADDRGATPANSATKQAKAGTSSARGAPARIVPGGPLAPASVGGLAALWAPRNVVGSQPGTARDYSRASQLKGLPGYLLVADRGNNRILVLTRRAGSCSASPTPPISPAGRRAALQRRHVRRARRAGADRQRGGQPRDRRDRDRGSLAPTAVRPSRRRRRRRRPTSTPPTTPTAYPTARSRSPTRTTAASCSSRNGAIVRQLGASGDLPPRSACSVRCRQRRHAEPGAACSSARYRELDRRRSAPPGRLTVCVPGARSRTRRIRSRSPAAGSCSPTTRAPATSRSSITPATCCGATDRRAARPHGPPIAGDGASQRRHRGQRRLPRPRDRDRPAGWVGSSGSTATPTSRGTAPGYLNTPDGMDFIPAASDGSPDYAAVVHP